MEVEDLEEDCPTCDKSFITVVFYTSVSAFQVVIPVAFQVEQYSPECDCHCWKFRILSPQASHDRVE